MRSLTELIDNPDLSHGEHCETYAHYIAEYERRIMVLKCLIEIHEQGERDADDKKKA